MGGNSWRLGHHFEEGKMVSLANSLHLTIHLRNSSQKNVFYVTAIILSDPIGINRAGVTLRQSDKSVSK